MKVFTRLWPSPGLVVACIALLVALGGTGYAVTGGSVRSSGYKIVKATSAMDSSTSHSVSAVCPSGKQVVGGGFRFNVSSTPAPIQVQYSGPLLANQWNVYGFEDSPYLGNWQVIAWAICIS